MKKNTFFKVASFICIVFAVIILRTVLEEKSINVVSVIALCSLFLAGAFAGFGQTAYGKVCDYRELNDGNIYTIIGLVGSVCILKHVDRNGDNENFATKMPSIVPPNFNAGKSFKPYKGGAIVL